MLIKKYNNSDLRMVDTEGKNILHFAIQAEDSTVFKVKFLVGWDGVEVQWIITKKTGFNMNQSRHCAYVTYSVKTWF